MTPMSCGEATIALLAKYGVRKIFGIPGVHTLEFCRGLNKHVDHVQTKHEQGAGYMAEGWARATGEPGVALVISGPGVTNAATALAQSWCDSIPVLLISAEPPTETLGKGWGVLHEITEQRKVTEPITAFSATALSAADVPDLIGKAFAVFASERPRPVHISIPIDVQEERVTEEWMPVVVPSRRKPEQADIDKAASMLRSAQTPFIFAGGGATDCGSDIVEIAEAIGATIGTSSAGKGIVSEAHPQSIGAAVMREQGRECLENADVVLAIGTELSETDTWVERLDFKGRIIRVDIDPSKIADLYPAELGIIADAKSTTLAISEALAGHLSNDRKAAEERVAAIKSETTRSLEPFEQRHVKLLNALDEIAPTDTVFAGDACQVVYTGCFAMPRNNPRTWFFPAGYCTLGASVPNAIGAKMAKPDSPVSVLVGDGGFMFTMPEILVAAEHGLPIPIIIWDNGALKQIRDDMDARGIERVAVEGLNPDFVALAKSCHCNAAQPSSLAEFKAEWLAALKADRPTVIVVNEDSDWLEA